MKSIIETVSSEVKGETLHTENSYKFDPDDFILPAGEAGMVREGYWTDRQGYFSVQFFRREDV